jgi:hypothetical protein
MHQLTFTPRSVPGTHLLDAAVVLLEGLGKLKNQVTSEIKHATFWFVA